MRTVDDEFATTVHEAIEESDEAMLKPLLLRHQEFGRATHKAGQFDPSAGADPGRRHRPTSPLPRPRRCQDPVAAAAACRLARATPAREFVLLHALDLVSLNRL